MSEPRQWYRIENAASEEAADVHIYDEISHWGILADDFRRELAAVTAPTIRLHLNSPGGYVDDGIAIYNGLKDHPATVHAFIEGVAASIASVIAMAGDRVVIAPHARMMVHNARIIADGDDEEFTKLAERLRDSNRNIASIYVERAGGDLEEWLALMKATTWFTDQGAVAAGLADEIGRSNDDTRAAALAARQVAQFDLSRYPQGDRMVAQIVTELVHGDVLPDDPEPPPDDPIEEPPDPIEPPAPQPEDWVMATHRRLAAEREELDAYLGVEKVKEPA